VLLPAHFGKKQNLTRTPNPKNRRRPGSPHSKQLRPFQAEHQRHSPPAQLESTAPPPILGKSKTSPPPQTPKIGEGQVHPIAKSVSPDSPTVNANRLRLNPKVPPLFHFGKPSLNSIRSFPQSARSTQMRPL
jgi:hypothetical protein